MRVFSVIEEKFFQLLQIAVGRSSNSSVELTDEEWAIIHRIAYEQCLLGIVLNAVDASSQQGQKPPVGLLYTWIGECESIRQSSKLLDSRCEQLTAWFKKVGYPCCIIKGQGVARLYMHPECRQAGDIDIWVDAKRDEVVKKNAI